MNATRKTFFALTTAFAMTSAACGGSSGLAPRPPSAPDAPQGGFAAAERQASSSPAGAGALLPAEGTEAPAAPPPPPGAMMPQSSADRSAEVAPEPKERPGLGTEWGETRTSHITTVPFVRADPDQPMATATLFYNDEEGAQAMASGSGFRRTGGSFPVAGGAVSVALRDEGGRFLSGFVAGGRSFVVGEAGRRYSIVLRNQTDNRFECVLSVDGLDVLDGREASPEKRGYLLDPHGELEIDGFRQSMDSVAAFRFGSVRGSYANQKHGDTRNVGVIGVALFHERGSNPFPWTRDEVDRRRNADPFPGRFAAPPN
jgi:hypothetical protein